MDYIILILAISIVVIFILFYIDKNNIKSKFQRIYNDIQENHKVCNENNEKVKSSFTISLKELEILIQNNTDKLESAQNVNSDSLKQFTISTLNEMSSDINNRMSTLTKIVEQLSLENQELKNKLAFFTEIEADSKTLNENEDILQRESLIQEALNEIKNISTSKEQAQTNSELLQEQEFLTKEVIDKPKSITSSNKLNILDEEQQKAFDIMENTNQNIFISGKAGTGKSFLLEVFVRASNKKVLKLAPTGVAALNIGGATIHSAFGYYNIENLTENQITTDLRLKSEKQLVLKNSDVIIIDEISMIRSDKFGKIDKILRKVNGNNIPFGGKQIIVFGDLFQLPPIAKPQELKYLSDTFGGIHFFNSNSYRQNNFKFIELSVNHRQEGDLRFFEILNRMREGVNTEDDIRELNKRNSFNQNELRRVITLFPTKALAEEKNKNELNKIESKEYSYQAKIIFNITNNQTPNLESIFPISSTLKLKLGALVMMVANDVDKRWVNGTLGIVSYISQSMIKVKIDGYEYEVHKKEFTSQEAIYKNGEIHYQDVLQVTQYPLVLAYAITIHKSQGMTYQKVACDISNCFSAGQAYVALSRCSSLDGLYLLEKLSNNSTIQVDPNVRDFYLNLIN